MLAMPRKVLTIIIQSSSRVVSSRVVSSQVVSSQVVRTLIGRAGGPQDHDIEVAQVLLRGRRTDAGGCDKEESTGHVSRVSLLPGAARQAEITADNSERRQNHCCCPQY